MHVRVLLLVGGEAEIVPDSGPNTAPVRYPAPEIADAVGVDLEQLPGMRLWGDVGPGGRLGGWRRA